MNRKYKIALSIVILLLFAFSLYLLLSNSNGGTTKNCSWTTGSWSECIKGTKTRTVTCKGGCDCTDQKPSQSADCSSLPYCCDYSTGKSTPNTSGCGPNGVPISDPKLCEKSDFPYVRIYKPGDDANTQKDIDRIFSTQGGSHPETNGQFSPYNYALLFMPGSYTVNVPVGYYTHVAGLGETVDKVNITGGPRVDNASPNHALGALDNFWRTCENMTINPTFKVDGKNAMIWATSQAASLRSVHVMGDLRLGAMAEDGQMGYASGGFLSNCKIDGQVNMGSQQQFICRNSEWASFPIHLWNQVNVGCVDKSNKMQTICKNGLFTGVGFSQTIIPKTPKIAEKPFLIHNEKSTTGLPVSIQVPDIKTDSNGYAKNSGRIIEQFFITNPKTTTAKIINQQIQAGMDILITPGTYNIEEPIVLSGQLIFGLGIPRLVAINNTDIITGYGSICGIICVAGKQPGKTTNTNTLINLSGNPSYLWDVFARVGGGENNSDIYSVDKMLHIGGDNSIIDNTWCWVADHYSDNTHTGWDKAVCNTGVSVTGNNVIFYGLFSEHNRHLNVDWSGDNGQVYMYQSEFNYFPPDQQTFNETVSYNVQSTVTSHTIIGAGAYSYFPYKPIFAKAGFSFPSSVKYKNIVTVFLNGKGGIKNVLDTNGTLTGSPVQWTTPIPPATLAPTQLSYLCGN